jgi:hypothetical protein
MGSLVPLPPFTMADQLKNAALYCYGNVDMTMLANIWMGDEILANSVKEFEKNNPGHDWLTSELYTSRYVTFDELFYFFNLPEYPPVILPEPCSENE